MDNISSRQGGGGSKLKAGPDLGNNVHGHDKVMIEAKIVDSSRQFRKGAQRKCSQRFMYCAGRGEMWADRRPRGQRVLFWYNQETRPERGTESIKVHRLRERDHAKKGGPGEYNAMGKNGRDLALGERKKSLAKKNGLDQRGETD